MSKSLSRSSDFSFLMDYFRVEEIHTEDDGLIALELFCRKSMNYCRLLFKDQLIIEAERQEKRLFGTVTKERLIDEIESVFFIVSSFDYHNSI